MKGVSATGDRQRPAAGGPNYCPNCGHHLTAGQPTAAAAPRPSLVLPPPKPAKPDAATLARFLEKLKLIAPSFDDLSEEQWGAWVDKLPQPEFLAMIALSNEGLAAHINKFRAEAQTP